MVALVGSWGRRWVQGDRRWVKMNLLHKEFPFVGVVVVEGLETGGEFKETWGGIVRIVVQTKVKD